MSKKTGALTLHLKEPWWSMIKSGEKTEEYREIKYPYTSIFGNTPTELDRAFHTLEFCIGYPSRKDTERWITFKNPKIRIDYGKPEWGAQVNELYYVITWERK